jgi:ArsR family transcriptional regulator, arsenate/arsenite/antimonite-responsive transcriptional repressor
MALADSLDDRRSDAQRADDKQMARVLKALADPRRFQMVQAIAAAGELSCGQVCQRFPLSQPAISHHLKILHDADLLVVREQGQRRFISVNRALLQSVLRLLSNRLRFGSAIQQAKLHKSRPR